MIENVSTQLTVFHCLCPLPASRKGLRLPLRSALFGEGGRDWRPCICMLGNRSCFYFRLLTFFKITFFFKINHQDHHQSVKQFGSRSRSTFYWSSSGFKLFAKGYWQMTKLATGMQRVITGKYFSVQYIVSYRDIHASRIP